MSRPGLLPRVKVMWRPQQAMKAIEYIDATQERQRKYLKACSPKALTLIAENGPEYLQAVSAAAE